MLLLSKFTRRKVLQILNYAANFLVYQIKRSNSVSTLKRTSLHQSEINASDFVVKFSLNVSDCNFYTSIELPCQHIFAARKMGGIDLFDESLCDMRWTASHYHRRQRMFLNKLEVGPSKVQQLCQKQLSRNKKFPEASMICVKIASLDSDVGGIHYQRGTKLFHNLAFMQGDNQEVSIKSVDHESKFLLLLLHLYTSDR